MLKRIKKTFICGSILSLSLILSACSSPEGENVENIADNGIKGIEPPEGCEVIDNIDEFEQVTGDQSYNTDTDANPSFYILNGTDAGGALYCFSGHNWLCYFDKKTGGFGIVCGKPDCEHSDAVCNAYVYQTWGTQYYEGYLYTVTINLELMKLSLDGSQRENFGKLADIDVASTLNWLYTEDIYTTVIHGIQGQRKIHII